MSVPLKEMTGVLALTAGALATMGVLKIPFEFVQLQQQAGTFQKPADLVSFLGAAYTGQGVGLATLRTLLTPVFICLLFMGCDIISGNPFFYKYISTFLSFSGDIKGLDVVFTILVIIISLVLFYPIDTLRTLLFSDSRFGVADIYQQRGFSGLYGGIGYAIAGLVVFYVVYILLKYILDPNQPKKPAEPKEPERFLLGGTVTSFLLWFLVIFGATMCLYPLETMRRQVLLFGEVGSTDLGSLYEGAGMSAILVILSLIVKVLIPGPGEIFNKINYLDAGPYPIAIQPAI